MPDLFLSHTSSDKPFVEKLAIDLKKAGIKVWYDSWEIRVGDSIVDKINNALSTNDCLLIVLSPSALESNWVRKELSSSLMRSLSDRSIKLLPVLHKQCKIPPILADIKYADFTSDYSKGLAELAAALDIINPTPGYLLPPKQIVGNDMLLNSKEYGNMFPYSFADYPDCLYTNGEFDVSIIVGSTEREYSAETEIFNNSNVDISLWGTKWSFSRQVSPGSVRDSVRAVDLAAFLGFNYARSSTVPEINWPDNKDILCVMDVSASSEIFNRNLFLVGGADTNIFIPIATIAFRQRFGYSLPIRYFGDEQLYFTCDQIYSEMSRKKYSRLEDLSYMHCGYILMTANPWCLGKVLIFAVGTRATGTQAALLALMRGKDYLASRRTVSEPWHQLAHNNKYYPSIPGKIVRARDALIVDGITYVHDWQKISIPDKARISQRHIVNDFEFLE